MPEGGSDSTFQRAPSNAVVAVESPLDCWGSELAAVTKAERRTVSNFQLSKLLIPIRGRVGGLGVFASTLFFFLLPPDHRHCRFLVPQVVPQLVLPQLVVAAAFVAPLNGPWHHGRT